MITLLKSGYGKIMLLFQKDKAIKLHLREIARQAKLYGPSVTRFLRSLEKEGILAMEKEGNLKKYFIKRNKKTFLIFALFDLEKFGKLPRLRQSAINCYLQKLPEQPVFAVVFGSTAKETYGDDSDLDILLVTNKKISPRESEKEANALTGMKISTFQISYHDFLRELKLKEDKVVSSAVNTGYPLLNHIGYYEALYHEGI